MCFLFFLCLSWCVLSDLSGKVLWLTCKSSIKRGKKHPSFSKWYGILSAALPPKPPSSLYRLSPHSTLQTNHGGRLMEIELMWTTLNQSEAVLEHHEVSPPCMWLEVVHEDPSHVRCWQPGIGPGASGPWPFTCWICQTYKPEPQLPFHADETGTWGWSVLNLSFKAFKMLFHSEKVKGSITQEGKDDVHKAESAVPLGPGTFCPASTSGSTLLTFLIQMFLFPV